MRVFCMWLHVHTSCRFLCFYILNSSSLSHLAPTKPPYLITYSLIICGLNSTRIIILLKKRSSPFYWRFLEEGKNRNCDLVLPTVLPTLASHVPSMMDTNIQQDSLQTRPSSCRIYSQWKEERERIEPIKYSNCNDRGNTGFCEST